MAASLAALGLWLAGSAALAQTASRPDDPTPPYPSSGSLDANKVLHFRKPASSPWVYASQPAAIATQPPMQRGPLIDPGESEIPSLEPPGPQEIFKLDSEARFQERLRQKGRDRTPPEPIQFPDEAIAVVGKGPYQGRHFAQRDMLVEPSYVCYGRLYFEDKNSERYGWDLGFIQPFMSAGIFYWDLATLPYRFWTNPCRWYECSSGYCLPGDPVPYLIYPPQISLTGIAAEAATVVGLLAAFP
jgi:hypothetical protein